MIACCFLERLDRAERSLRRYVNREGGGYTCAEGWHEAVVAIGVVPMAWRDDGIQTLGGTFVHEGDSLRDDPRWPAECAQGCGYRFADSDYWQLNHHGLYRRSDTGEEVTLQHAPVGAMWYADWMSRKGPDGHALCVRLPGDRDWLVDSRASNCTLPDDREHYCWVRHGEPPLVTVDKDGLTCSAGAGSIAVPGYHGFLRQGMLT